MDQYRMIDASDISGFMSAMLAFVKSIFSYIIRSLKRFWLAAIIVFGITIIAGHYWQKKQQYLYQSEAAFMFNNLGRRTFGEMIDKLNNLIQTKSYHTLAATLDISEHDAQSLRNIYAQNMNGTPVLQDFSASKAPFYVTIIATDYSAFVPLQTGLQKYLNSSPFRQKRNTMELERENKRIAFAYKDLEITDSLVSAYMQYLKRSVAADSAQKLAQVSSLIYYRDSLENKILYSEWKVGELQQTVEILHGFLPPENPSQSRIKIVSFPMNIISAFVAACFVCVCFMAAYPSQKKRKPVYEEQDIVV